MSKGYENSASGGASKFTPAQENAIELIKIAARNVPKLDMFGKPVPDLGVDISTKLSFKQNDQTGGLDVVVARKEGKDPSKPSTNTKRLITFLPTLVDANGGGDFGEVKTGRIKLSNTIILTL